MKKCKKGLFSEKKLYYNVTILFQKRNRLRFEAALICRNGGKIMKQDMIVILDLGSTENTVIARQIRDMGVYSEIHPTTLLPRNLQH